MEGLYHIFIIFVIFQQVSNGQYLNRHQACADICGVPRPPRLSHVEPVLTTSKGDVDGRVGENIGSLGISVGPSVSGGFKGKLGFNSSTITKDSVHDGYEHVKRFPDGSTYTTFKDIKVRDRHASDFFGEVSGHGEISLSLGTFFLRKRK